MLNLSLHPKQADIFFDEARVKVLCAGRGVGKSVLLLTTAILICLNYKGAINPVSPQQALICMPTLKMARSIHWQALLNLVERLPLVDKVDRSNFRIVFKGERPDLILRGADLGGDRLRGLNLVWAGLDEFQDFHPEVWDKVLRPALTRNKNWAALVIGTPKGKVSYFYKFHVQAIANAEWAYFHAVTADNPFLDLEEIARAERELPPKVFRQEYLASWEEFDGQFFSSIDESAKASVVPDNFKACFLSGDWGDVNPCLMVTGVTHSGDYYMLDHWQGDGSTPVPEDDIKSIASDFCTKYRIAKAFLPDDRPASIMSFRRYGKKHGVDGLKYTVQVKRNSPGVMERAIIGNSLFHQNRLFFTPKTAHLYDTFSSYHRDKDAAGNLLTTPAKGQDSHAVDSELYLLGQLEGRYVRPK